ncbi:MAG TPA: ferrochelatase [Gammaproteobacteria bacterium]|nr:ferrochelatase [Gammaproteobacteria bacterium]
MAAATITNHPADTQATAGILLTNLGTPEAPTPAAVRHYLAEFLSDPRVIDKPRWLWLPILYGLILNIRPQRSAHAYQQIWMPQGSPLLVISRQQTQALQEAIKQKFHAPIQVALGMRYGRPSLKSALETLRQSGLRRLLILPLYPQYSATTTASTFDAVARVLHNWRWLPELRTVNGYHDDPRYIAALAASARRHWEQHGRGQKLVMSFHGLPERYLRQGDPYHCFCHKTARLLAENLQLANDGWCIAFQSRVGFERWLRPYTDKILVQLAKQGVQRVDLICPGFSVDCLETLEENNIRNREFFLKAGGKEFNYIPCLNDHADHIRMMTGLIEQHTHGWPEFSTDWDKQQQAEERKLTNERAQAQINKTSLRG